MKSLKHKKGITLIALIITIIVLLILAGVTFNLISGGDGILGKTEKSAFFTKVSAYKEQVEMYDMWQISETLKTDISWINSGEPLKEAIEQGIVIDLKSENVTIKIEDILDDITEEDKEYFVVYKGELCYVSNKSLPNNEKFQKWCEELGIKILEIEEPEPIEIRNGSYELVNGVYLCTPKLDEGFVQEKTRYLEVSNSGNLVPGNWITDKPTENWYSYKEKKWANIYVENDGSDVYYVWIPRYCFKLDQDKQRSDVKFIDVDNSYIDAETGVKTEWADLQKDGYQVPEAFLFNETNLAGYWAMKYTVGDITSPSIINYDMSVVKGKVTIKNMAVNTSAKIAKFTIALNGKIVQEITDSSKISAINSEEITFEGLREGDNTINVTALNTNGEIIGSMTKEYAPAVVNQPDLTGFEPETTFYVTYDDAGNEHSTVPITEPMPKYWYEYGASQWANIVTRNNDLETYYVWIPRYEFKLDQKNQRSNVRFITGTSTAVDTGYQIPEAFTFNGQQLTGYWAMKYTAGDASAPRFNTEVVATSNSIRTKGITGTATATGQVYKYYLNGEYKGESKDSTKNFEYSNLESNKKYTVLVEIRSKKDVYLGAIVKQISTVDANKPELIGFNADCTYYVLYDEKGNETIGNKIENDGSNMPNGWYDYSKSKWANIVVQANGMKTYYTWIPRYEFKITSSQYTQPAQARTEVRFLNGTSKDTDLGYQIPEAFKFNNQELTGYWAMKYTAGE